MSAQPATRPAPPTPGRIITYRAHPEAFPEFAPDSGLEPPRAPDMIGFCDRCERRARPSGCPDCIGSGCSRCEGAGWLLHCTECGAWEDVAA